MVEKSALVDSSCQQSIAGAALDVFSDLDVFARNGAQQRHALMELDNLITTPHRAGSSVESTEEPKVRGARHAPQVLLGQRPSHIVNSQVLPKVPLS